jgi:endonuclease YncB( thermonuclease family)
MSSRSRLLPRVLGYAALIALASLPAAAADGVSGAAHAFRGDIVIIRGTKILLFGLTAPADSGQCTLETGPAPCTEAAKANLEILLEDGPISCSFVRKVGHGSYQGRCQRSDGTDIGLMLLRQGWARADAEASEEYQAAEAEARAKNRGLWANDPN